LYRDGSKLSQPLSNKSDKKKKVTDDAQLENENKSEARIVDMSTAYC